MNRKSFRLIGILLAFAFVVSFTSCNRGMGCPNNFSISDAPVEIME